MVMSTVHPRRFVMAAAPSATAWIEAAFQRAFGPPERSPDELNRLVERLQQAR
jgi:hypothetical protein